MFALYREALSIWACGTAVVASADAQLLTLMLGILGGSIAGKWIVHALIARAALAGVASISAWLAIDSAYSLANNGLFNIALVNVPAALMTLPAWLLLRSRLRHSEP